MCVLDELEALFVDVGKTLIRPRAGVGARYAEAARAVGVDATAAELDARVFDIYDRQRVQRRRPDRLAYGRTEAEAREFWRGVVAEAFSPWGLDDQVFARLFDRLYARFARADAWEVFSDTAPLLQAAEARGLPVVVVSNWDARLDPLLRTLGIAPRLHALVGSYAVDAEKPDPRIFEAALATLPSGTRRDRVLHIGDKIDEDYQAARLVGLRARHLDRPGRHADAAFRCRTLACLSGVKPLGQ